MAPNPILVEVVRGEIVESFHRGAACIVDYAGRIIASWGDIERPVCPRSAIKPFQTIPLLESGAGEAFHLSDQEVALACASHSGEPEHIHGVSAWLKRMDLGVDNLECGAHAPTSTEADEALIREGRKPTALHNNCSGKHTGFLALARHLGAETKGYTHFTHPVQQTIFGTLEEMTEYKIMGPGTPAPVVDGCSAPNVFLPLRAIAGGLAKLGNTEGLGRTRGQAAKRIVTAMKTYPILMSGHRRPCARLIAALDGRGIVKTGAEGVFAAVLPEQGVGIAVKIDDGAARAAVIAITALLDYRRAFRADAAAEVAALKLPEIKAWAGTVTGLSRPATSWL